MSVGRERRRQIVMLGPSTRSMGGMAAVVSAYDAAGLFAAWPITYIDTHRETGRLGKVSLAVGALTRVLRLSVQGSLQGFHFHVALRTSFWRKSVFMLVARMVGKPYVVHLHGADFDVFYERECGPVAKRYIRFCLLNSAAVIVLSNSWKRWVQSIVPGANIRCVYNPVRIPDESAPGPFGAANCHVLFLGQLGDRKGVADLIHALAAIRSQLPAIQLTCGGDGDPEAFRRLAVELGVGDVVAFPGWVVGPEKQQLMDRAACFILPSYHEGLPMAMLEAMAAGVPVIATRVGGIPEAVTDGEEGFLVDPGDIRGLSQALLRILGDPPQRRMMSEKARAKARRLFEDRAIVHELSALYAELGFSPCLRTVEPGVPGRTTS